MKTDAKALIKQINKTTTVPYLPPFTVSPSNLEVSSSRAAEWLSSYLAIPPGCRQLEVCWPLAPSYHGAMSGYARPGFPYQVLEVKSVTRPLDVTATLVGSGGLLGINPASDTVLLQLVEDAKVQTFILKL